MPAFGVLLLLSRRTKPSWGCGGGWRECCHRKGEDAVGRRLMIFFVMMVMVVILMVQQWGDHVVLVLLSVARPVFACCIFFCADWQGKS